MRKNCFYSLLVFTAFLTCLVFMADAQAVQVTAKLDAQTIRIGDQTKLRLIVNQSAKEKVNFPKLADSITSKVQIVSSKLDTIRDKANSDQLIVSDIITITSFDQGTYTIPAFSFGTTEGVQTSEPLTLVVQTVQVDTTKAIYDIKQPIAVSYGFFDWLKDNILWVGLGLLVIAIIVGVIIYLKKRPKPLEVVKEVKPDLPAHVIAITKLQQLRERKLWQSDAVKAYYSELSDIIREYLENRYVIKTHEKITDEILTALRHMDISNEYREKLRQMLMLSDLVKFAKEKPLPEENELTMESAIDFVTKTQQRPQAPQATEGGNANV